MAAEPPGPRGARKANAVVDLAGASIAGRFTDHHKREIRDSRVGPTKLLARAIASMGVPLGALVAAVGDRLLRRGPGRRAAHRGRLPRDRIPGRPGGGVGGGDAGRPGRGRACRARAHGHCAVDRGRVAQAPSPALRRRPGGSGQRGGAVGFVDRHRRPARRLRSIPRRRRAHGPVNAVAPHTVRNREYATTLADVLRRPALLPVPALGPRVLFGSRGGDRAGPGQSTCRPRPAHRLGAHAFAIPTSNSACGTSWATSATRIPAASRSGSRSGRPPRRGDSCAWLYGHPERQPAPRFGPDARHAARRAP